LRRSPANIKKRASKAHPRDRKQRLNRWKINLSVDGEDGVDATEISISVDGEDGVDATEISIEGDSSNLRDCPECPRNPSFKAPYLTCSVRRRTANSRHSTSGGD
jgi:hypothetical protein